MVKAQCLVMLVLFLFALVSQLDACTTLLAGAKATKYGGTLLSHSEDAENNPDARVVKVPSRFHPPGSMRKVWWDKEDYPRYIGYDRSPSYWPEFGMVNLSVPIGEIPQVAHTYSYFEGNYGIINEHQVGFGESTCSAVFGATSIHHGGAAMMAIDDLSHIALERCKTARCAVQTMGDLAVKYGFYGAGQFEGSGENLMVEDPNEGFVFHILPDDTQKSAIWVAQRVPDDHVAVVANMFTIRNVNLSDTFNFMGSKNIHSVAQKHGWWKPSDGLLDFTRVYSDGEYANKYYSGRRMWRAYQLLAPEHPISSSYSDLLLEPYPFSLPAKKGGVTPRDFFAVHRDYYQDTEFDMTKGMAAGPFNNPDRYLTKSDIKGNWERSIGLFRTAATYVVQTTPSKSSDMDLFPKPGIAWIGQHATAGTVFVPLLSNGDVPFQMTVADPTAVDRRSAYWAHKYVYNLAHMFYGPMMKIVNKWQDKFESEGESLMQEMISSPFIDRSYSFQNLADRIFKKWWNLPDELMVQFGDGWGSQYPDWWLKNVEWVNGPPPPPHKPPKPVEE